MESEIDHLIVELLSVRPYRLTELQAVLPVSVSSTLHRLNMLEMAGEVVVERIPYTSTTYRLATDSEVRARTLGSARSGAEL